MLCRVLFVAAVVSYVLCVLLLSGVQKDELDASTLRKLQRHNVNIDAIGNRKLRSQCLTENNSATTLSTLPVKVNDETKKSSTKPIAYELDTQVRDSPAQWNKLFAYLNQQKDQNASHLKETTMQSIIIQNDSKIDTLPSPIQNHFIEDIISRVDKVPENKVNKNKNEKAQYSTSNDYIINERSNDAEYIRKIVAEILSQTQTKPVETSTVLPVRTFNANKLIEDIDKVLEENKKNEQTNYSLMTKTEKLENTSNHNKGNKEERKIIEDFLNQLHNPISNIRNSLISNIQTELKQGKVTLYNARDKLSDMLNIVKNEPNNWLYAIDSQSIKPIDSEPFADQNVEDLIELSEHNKAMLCKSNNKIHLIQKEIYRYICPYDQSSKQTGAMPEEQNNLQLSQQIERNTIGSSKSVNKNDHYSIDNKTIWPYFYENQNNGKDQKLEMGHNSLDINLPSNGYESMKPDDSNKHYVYRSNLPYLLERKRNTEQEKIYRDNPKLLYNEPNDREQVAIVKMEANKNKINNFEKHLYPLKFAEHWNGGSDYKAEWAFNTQSAKELEPKLEKEQENPSFIRPLAGEKLPNRSYPSVNGEFKNTWPYFFDDIRITPNPDMVDKIALYQIPPGRHTLLNNQEHILLQKEGSINNRLDRRETESELLSRNRSDPKFFNWYETKGHDMKDNKSTGTLDLNAKEQQKSITPDEVTNAENNIRPNNYERINWPYLIERQKARVGHIATEDTKKEPLYTNDSKITKHLNYEYALPQKDELHNKLLMNTETRSDLHQQYIVTEKSENDINEKVKSLPLDVLKEIANTVKEIVLKDLKTEKPITSTATATITTTTATPIMTTAMTPTTITSTTITSTTTTIPISITVITKTEPKTTTGTTPSTTVKEDSMKIQEASQVLKKFMELFEKFNLMKNDNQNPNITLKQDNITQTQRAEVIAMVPKMIHNPYAPYRIATMPTIEHNPYASYKFYAPLLPPMSSYGIKSPYLQTKAMVLDPYLQKIIQVPTTIHNNAIDNIHTVSRSAHALTFQTNSNEIKPLKVPVSKGIIVDNIVLSPKPPRDRGRHLREYSEETYRYRKPNRYTQRNEYNIRSNRSRDFDFKFDKRPKSRSTKKEYSYSDRFYKPRTNYENVRFHEKLEKDNWPRSSEGKCGSKEGCNDRVVPRQQRPLINIASTYDDTHFRNFLKTQQKVNDMLERILATKTKQNRHSGEVI
ncbi:uncharacterized protein isoform X2 [Choristoneura fumiferana]|uniref:uncharacterized protein isoform X2 n=1 Tax=Choristoneura fumiferana TaxID=7141 RepID=UPI003D15E685